MSCFSFSYYCTFFGYLARLLRKCDLLYIKLVIERCRLIHYNIIIISLSNINSSGCAG